MSITLKQVEQGTPVTLLTTELNSLGNNANQISSVGGTSGVFTNTQGTANLDGYVRAKLELVLASLTVTAGGSVKVWFVQTVDGTNYEDGGSSVTPARNPDVIFPLNSGTAAQRVVRRAWVPVGTWKILARNDATGVALANANNTLKLLANTDQGV